MQKNRNQFSEIELENKTIDFIFGNDEMLKIECVLKFKKRISTGKYQSNSSENDYIQNDNIHELVNLTSPDM